MPGNKGGYVAISALEQITAKFCKFCGVEVAKPLNIKNGNTEALEMIHFMAGGWVMRIWT